MQLDEELIKKESKAYENSLNNGVYFPGDIQSAVLAGCNSATGIQHNRAQEVVDRYMKGISPDCVYTAQDIRRAYETGVRTISLITEKEPLKVTVKGEDSWKVVQLIAASQQMMDLGKQFMEEVESVLKKYYIDFRTEEEYRAMREYYNKIREKLNPIFNQMGTDEGYRWGEDYGQIEDFVRDLFKVDDYKFVKEHNFKY